LPLRGIIDPGQPDCAGSVEVGMKREWSGREEGRWKRVKMGKDRGI
jgi:hypothetical protein